MDSAARTRRGASPRADAKPSRLAWASAAVAGWGLCYALYRGYYAVGGTAFLPGRPANPSAFRMLNMAATIILLIAAVLPIAMLPLWPRRRVGPVLLAVCWVIAVGCGMHGIIDAVQRVLSLAGLLDVRYPEAVWASIDTRTADLQDLFFNEPWFMLEGLGFAALAWITLGPGRARRAWVGSALAATGALTVIGLLSATGVIGRLIIG
ncbi:hypothetical protein [Dactylosporangium sp. NPDC048998]|uniref:hypothetical protein n=1 Tax=Dactylosporangium sp. NPDC048998 TaxID=3363976 RepID=UPI003716E126